jgi:hypothetical protein
VKANCSLAYNPPLTKHSRNRKVMKKEEQSNNDMNKILWISNNPQCKLIESCYNSISKKCICPKEEPKQDLEKEMFELEQELDIPSSMRWHNSKPKQEIKLEDIFNDEKKQGVKDLIDAHKQETLKEVAKSEAFEFSVDYKPWETDLDYREYAEYGFEKGFIEGTKWQVERMYSEEEVIELIKKAVYQKQNAWKVGELDKWFEQFKKK